MLQRRCSIHYECLKALYEQIKENNRYSNMQETTHVQTCKNSKYTCSNMLETTHVQTCKERFMKMTNDHYVCGSHISKMHLKSGVGGDDQVSMELMRSNLVEPI